MAANKAFNIYEICEQIMLQLDDERDLIRCLHLSKTVRATILDSALCRQWLFLSGDHFALKPREWRINEHLSSIGTIASNMGYWTVRVRDATRIKRVKVTLDLEQEGRITTAPVAMPQIRTLLGSMQITQPRKRLTISWGLSDGYRRERFGFRGTVGDMLEKLDEEARPWL